MTAPATVEAPKRDAARSGRVEYADELRVAAIFAVAALHVAGGGWSAAAVNGGAWQALNLYDGLIRWCVPVFVMLSGMFLLNPKRRLPLKTLYGKNILRLAVALLFWGVLYGLADARMAHGFLSWADILPALETVLRGKAHYHLWFLYMLIGLYIVAPLLRAMVAGASRVQLRYFLVLALLFSSCLPLLIRLLPDDGLKTLVGQFQLHLVLGYAGYFVAGYYFHTYPPRGRTRALLMTLGGLGAAATVVGTWLVSAHMGKAWGVLYEYYTPNVALAAVGVFLLFQRWGGRGRVRWGRLAPYVFGVYLVHDAVFMVYERLGLTALGLGPVWAVPVLTVLVFLPSLLISFIISRVPVLRRYLV